MEEKKIIAISEEEFERIVSSTLIDMLKEMPATVENIDEYMGKRLGNYAGRIHVKLFSDKYVIGKKKCRCSSSNANSGISKKHKYILPRNSGFVKGGGMRNDLFK